MGAAMVYPKMSTHVRPLSKLHSLEPSVVICIVATFGMKENYLLVIITNLDF